MHRRAVPQGPRPSSRNRLKPNREGRGVQRTRKRKGKLTAVEVGAVTQNTARKHAQNGVPFCVPEQYTDPQYIPANRLAQERLNLSEGFRNFEDARKTPGRFIVINPEEAARGERTIGRVLELRFK